MTAALPIAVVGAGLIGLRHVEAAQACPAVDLAAVIEAHAPQREKLAALGVPVFAALDAAPSHLRAAIIATPTPEHAASARACLERGCAVLVEKPIAATLDEARALVAEAQARTVPLVVGHHRRCHPFAISARDAISTLGAPVGVQGLWSLRKDDAYFDAEWRRLPGAGPLMTNLSHEIDLMQFLLGPIAEVSALTSSARRGFAIEDTAALALRFRSGAMGSFLISDAGASPWAFEAATAENPHIAASDEDYLRITGTEGALAFPSLTQWGRGTSAQIDWGSPLQQTRPAPSEPVVPLTEQLLRFAHIVNGGTDDVLCTGVEGIAALEWTLGAAWSGKNSVRVGQGAVPGNFRGI